MVSEPPQVKPRRRYVNAGIPAEIMDLVDQVIDSHRYGFISRNGFILDAVKKQLEKLGFYPPRMYPARPRPKRSRTRQNGH